MFTIYIAFRVGFHLPKSQLVCAAFLIEIVWIFIE